mmetsp:Transcript_3291/g.6171  ORF Transcript_3291/g.6171 Transcript_3291/m.6171 type:complete len:581 (-) Transcript_3291:1613-3355(-)|eukprot:CAMPEP_0184679902 /NCGR_PEP_ID=MMETSP0312-20130426/2780_1 /TAXON_ID=31354 /ORGANISM="Compsopogon coeruleus, Strain SAG 36.94" /LENGTH=580 /DNA_ID=CAMNT_0027129665 /DNA_START=63 /DNA_END=1805 /DNA_ORIENTATION=-
MSFCVKDVVTSPIEGQKTGTSGLRKKVAVFMQPNYLNNWVQSLFSSLEDLQGAILALGGDGRYWNREAIKIILRIAAGNGVGKVIVGQDGILCTPAMSAVIRARKLFGGVILTASHNPAGPTEDFGIKYNVGNGGPAPESVTDKIFANTKSIASYKYAAVSSEDDSDPFGALDLSVLGSTKFTNSDGADFEVEVIDSADDYVSLLKTMFDFDQLKQFVGRSDFRFLFDGMCGVTGPYATRIFVSELGASPDSIMRGTTLEDFGGGHPDPNLTYAAELVDKCDPSKNPDAPDFGAASDGDGDRNMILGKGFFVTPSDSVAIIAARAQGSIPYFQQGLKGVARSMPTASALDHVAKKNGLEMFETPTGWKFFGNLMDAGRVQICGEESFGTGSDHVREKDGLFAILCWLSILATANPVADQPLVTVEDIVVDHWKTYGRNFFSRYDYENVDSDAASKVMSRVDEVMAQMATEKNEEGHMSLGGFETPVVLCDNFCYEDPVDGSVAKGQGRRFIFADYSRLVFRLSGTGSSGATIRMYSEKYEPNEDKQRMDAQEALKPLIELALRVSELKELTGRDAPTVIT